MASTVPTSFVPQKPLRQQVRNTGGSGGGGNVFMFAGVVILLSSLVLAGIVFAYKLYLTRERDMKTQEVLSFQQIDNQGEVEELSRLSDRIRIGKTLLESRIAPTVIFDYFSANTTAGVRFMSFSMSMKGDEVLLDMKGSARNFNALAYQANVFGQSDFVRSQLFSDITIGEKGEVSFSFGGIIKKSDILARGTASGVAPVATTTTVLPEEDILPLPPVTTSSTTPL